MPAFSGKRLFRILGSALLMLPLLGAANIVHAADSTPPKAPSSGSLVFIPVVSFPQTVPVAPSWASVNPAVAISDTAVALQWNDNSLNESGFRIDAIDTDSGKLANSVKLPANTTRAVVDSLPQATIVQFYLVAANSVGENGTYPIEVGTSKSTAPFPPYWFTATPQPSENVMLEWANASVHDTYIQESDNGGPFVYIATAPAGTTSYQVIKLLPDSKYAFRAFTNVNTRLNSDAAEAMTFPAAKPNPPSAFTASMATPTSIQLTWQNTDLNNINNVMYRKVGGGLDTYLASMSASVTSYTDQNLTPGQTYTYHLLAVNGYGQSSTGNVALTAPVPLPDPPTGIHNSYLAEAELDIAFTNSTYAAQINVWSSVNGGAYADGYTSAIGALPVSITDNALSGGTTYCYKIRSKNATGFSLFAAPVCATTYSSVAPSAPTNLAVSRVSATQLLMTFHHPLTNVWGFALSGSTDNSTWTEWTTVNATTVYIPVNGLAATYYFKVRAYVLKPDGTTFLYSAYTSAASVNMGGGGGGGGTTSFVNNASYPVISLKINGVEKIPSGGAIGSGQTVPMDLTAGSYTYAYTLGFYDGAVAYKLYSFSGSFTTGGTVTFRNATVGEILTPGGSTGYWLGSYWSNLSMGSAGFCFTKAGGYKYYVDGMPKFYGSTVMTNQPKPGTFMLNFSVGSGSNFTGTLNEIDRSFMMHNGPADWPIIEYEYAGASCP